MNDNDTRRHLRDLIAEDGISSDIWPGYDGPSLDNMDGMLDYTVTLRFGEREIVTPYFVEKSHRYPTAEDVLACFIEDARGLNDADSFYSWCADLDFDPNKDSTMRTWESVKGNTRALRSFLGERWLDYIGAELE